MVKNDFSNVHLAGHGKTINNFVQKYAARPEATQSLPGIGMAHDWVEQINKFYQEDQFNSKLSFEQLASDYLQSEGVSFGNHSLSLTSNDLKTDANKLQKAFLDGHSAMKILISFDTDYLINQNVVKLHQFKDSYGNKIAQSFPGGGFDLVDEVKLRYAVQNGMNKYVSQNGMTDPLWVGALQFDRQHVHAHIACVDQGELSQSKRLLLYNGVWQDRGKVLAKGKETIRSNVDSALTLSKGLHKSVVNNQSARALVNTKSQTFDLQQRYQQRLASQLLQLLRLNDSRINAQENDDLYYEKLGDYRDSLVMQEAKQFNLPQSMTGLLNQRLDQVLDQQIQQLGQQGVPDSDYLVSPSGLLNSSWSQLLQDDAQKQKQRVEQDSRDVSSWKFLLNDYNQQFIEGQTGNGSMTMSAFYGFEFDTALRRLAVDQASNPLGLVGNYSRRQDLVHNRKVLLDQRERLLEEGYRTGALNNPDQGELRRIVKNPQFQDELLSVANKDAKRGKYWLANQRKAYSKIEDVPAYQDLLLKAYSVDNSIGVTSDTVNQLSKTSFVRGELLNELAGHSMHPLVRSALNPSGNNLDQLKQYSDLQRFTKSLKDYQIRVANYTESGVRRGLIRPMASFSDPRVLITPDPIGRPLDVRNQFDIHNWRHLTDGINWKSSDGNLRFGQLEREQTFVKRAELYARLSNQPSLALTNVKRRQREDLRKLTAAQSFLGNQFKEHLKQDNQEILQAVSFRGVRQKKPLQDIPENPVANSKKRVEKTPVYLRELHTIRQQEMNVDEAENVVDDSRRLVHRVLEQELNL